MGYNQNRDKLKIIWYSDHCQIQWTFVQLCLALLLFIAVRWYLYLRQHFNSYGWSSFLSFRQIVEPFCEIQRKSPFKRSHTHLKMGLVQYLLQLTNFSTGQFPIQQIRQLKRKRSGSVTKIHVLHVTLTMTKFSQILLYETHTLCSARCPYTGNVLQKGKYLEGEFLKYVIECQVLHKYGHF